MKILLTGAFGQLGRSLLNVFPRHFKIIMTGHHIPDGENGIYLDIQDRINVNAIINLHKPDIIINLAALTDVDLCEKKPMLANEINVIGVANICDIFKGKIIQISTDYVFDGINGPYKEGDKVSPLSVYGNTKLKAEKIVQNHSPDNLIIRGNVIYDYTKHTNASFLNWIIDSLNNKEMINVVEDQINNPTWVKSMANVINLCIENKISGIFHWGDASLVSRYEFAKMIADRFSLDSTLIRPILTKELKQVAPRPLNSGLISDRLISIIDIVQPTITECLNKINLK